MDGKVLHFAMGDSATGELWVIGALPQYLGRGINSALLEWGSTSWQSRIAGDCNSPQIPA
jgi:hypothetical protein